VEVSYFQYGLQKRKLRLLPERYYALEEKDERLIIFIATRALTKSV
jgi:hypothetical protein